MVTNQKNPKNNLNPNWAQLLETIKCGSKKHFSKNNQRLDGANEKTTLGKRKERSNEDTVAKPNPLVPTSSDCSLTDAVAMDCEMVGVSSLGNKSALGRVTLVNKWGNVIYDEYVRPVELVTDYRTNISGIRPRDLKKGRLAFVDIDKNQEDEQTENLLPLQSFLGKAFFEEGSELLIESKKFNVVQKEVADLIKGRILVGHALHNDLKALLLSHVKKDIRDTSEYMPFLKEGRSRSLKHLASEFLGVEIQNGEHCPIQDARAAMLLYQKNRKQWERAVKDFIRLKEKQKKRKHKKPKHEEPENIVAAL